MIRQRRVHAAFLGVLLLAAAAGCQKKPADQSTATGSLADSAVKVRLAEGQRAYLANCAMCHGPWGLGDGPVATRLATEAHVTVATRWAAPRWRT
jgi:mono/diheme cytochrome c family protein